MIYQGGGLLRLLCGLDERGITTDFGEDVMLYHAHQQTSKFGREDWFYYEHSGISSNEAISNATAYFQDDREFQLFIEGYQRPWIYFLTERLAVALRKRLEGRGARTIPIRSYKIFPKPSGTMRPDGCDKTSQV